MHHNLSSTTRRSRIPPWCSRHVFQTKRIIVTHIWWILFVLNVEEALHRALLLCPDDHQHNERGILYYAHWEKRSRRRRRRRRRKTTEVDGVMKLGWNFPSSSLGGPGKQSEEAVPLGVESGGNLPCVWHAINPGKSKEHTTWGIP